MHVDTKLWFCTNDSAINMQGIVHNDQPFRFISKVINLKKKPSAQRNCRHKGYTKKITILSLMETQHALYVYQNMILIQINKWKNHLLSEQEHQTCSMTNHTKVLTSVAEEPSEAGKTNHHTLTCNISSIPTW